MKTIETRHAIALVALSLALTALSCWALTLGDYPIPVDRVLAALAGTEPNRLITYYVSELRLPRVLLALLVGAALGLSGALFQNLTRNALGSPDITGFTTGAATGALAQILLFGGSPTGIALGALAGGAATGTLVFLLARGAGSSSLRFVLIGIGVAFVLHGINSLLVVRADLNAAQTAAQWLAGSFNGTTWGRVAWVTLGLGVVTPLLIVTSRPLSMLAVGDELAAGLGVNVTRTRTTMTCAGVTLVAVAVAAAGPIAFVALAAGPISRRLAGLAGATAGLGVAGLTGALITLGSDIAAQRLFAPTQLPVGVVTGVIGGAYLLWLLTTTRPHRKNPHA